MATDERNRTLDLRPPPFPEEFGQRLEGLKDMTGLSWGEFAELLGVTERGLLKWRRGGPPSGAYFWAIMEVARGVPGGFDLMLDGDTGTEKCRNIKGGRSMVMDEGERIEDFRAGPFPEEFPAYLGRLEDLSGISLEEFADWLGLPEERPGEWRSGAIPTGDEMCAMIHWACRVPGGLSVLLTGDPYSLTVRE